MSERRGRGPHRCAALQVPQRRSPDHSTANASANNHSTVIILIILIMLIMLIILMRITDAAGTTEDTPTPTFRHSSDEKKLI